MRHSPIRTRGLTIALLWILTNVAAEAQQDETRAVSALGRIEPRGGVIKVGAPSTPEAISGAVLAQLLVKEGERVSAGQF